MQTATRPFGRSVDRPSASIVILAWNAWPMTRGCLETIRATLDVGDEVIVVDNGSTDETARSLAMFPWVKVVSNRENRGFAGGCNDGARVATRDVVIFLNNDTLLAGEWLDRLLRPFADPTVSATGPRSNFVSGSQMVEGTTYAKQRLTGLRRFVHEWERAYGERTEETGRLVGFCLAVRRTELEAIGGFDERFGLGGYEDDDLCVRLRARGGRLLIAHGSFVHHHGHATFDANGVNWAALEQQARTAFVEKHAPGSAAAAEGQSLLDPLPGEPGTRLVAVLSPSPVPELVAALELQGTAVTVVDGVADLRARLADLDPELVVAVDERGALPDLSLLDVPVVAWSSRAGGAAKGWFDLQAPAGAPPVTWVAGVLDRASRAAQFGCLLLRCRRAVDLGLVDEALHAASAAERLRPGTAQVANAMAVCAYAAGDTDRAVDLLRRALAIDPAHPTAGANLAALTGAEVAG